MGARRLAIIVAAILSSACLARAQSLDALYADARKEGALNLYGAGPAQNYEGLARAFEQKYPDIKVTITGGYSNELNARVEAQAKAGKFEADMAVFQTVQDFVRWKAAGLLASFKPEGFDAIDPSFKDPDGAFVALYVSTLSYAYNTKGVAAPDAPKSALDFLDPKYQGKLVSAYPHDDDATLYVFWNIIRRHGWDYMTRYMAQKPVFIQGHLGVARSVASGDTLVTLDASTSTVSNLKRAGQPIEFAFPDLEPTPVFTVTSSIFRDAPHPAAARLYLSYLLAREQQARSGFFSPRADVPPPAGMKPLFSNFVINQYREFVTNEPLIVDLRKRFEAITGPVRNAGGVK